MAWTTPATRTTGTLITAALWNAAVIDNIRFQGVTHDHSGDAGDGVTLNQLSISGIIGMFQSACPTGWTRVSAWDGRFIRGASSYGGTGGADTHTHTESHTHTISHTHGAGTLAIGAATLTSQWAGAGGTAVSSDTHTHTITGNSGAPAIGASGMTTGSGSTLPEYVDVVFCKKN